MREETRTRRPRRPIAPAAASRRAVRRLAQDETLAASSQGRRAKFRAAMSRRAASRGAPKVGDENHEGVEVFRRRDEILWSDSVGGFHSSRERRAW